MKANKRGARHLKVGITNNMRAKRAEIVFGVPSLFVQLLGLGGEMGGHQIVSK